MLGESPPWERDFHAPALICIRRVVERSPDLDRGFQSRDLPAVLGLASVFVRLRKEEIPAGVERVDFKLVVIVRIAVRIDEDLEVRIDKNDGIVLRQGGPDVRFLQLGRDVEIFIVPEHLRPGAKRRPGGPLDVHEILGPRRGRPGVVVQFPVDGDRGRRPRANIAARHDGLHFLAPLGPGIRVGRQGGGGHEGKKKTAFHSSEEKTLWPQIATLA